MQSHRLELIICLFLILSTILVYLPLSQHEFINFDDNIYVTENGHVKTGLNGRNIIWAFSTIHANFWHPLTWLSHMLDCELFGLNPGMHHLTNLLFHIANTILLFLIFNGMTGALWRSGFVAALFALHPLHVESVAWVSERKDVLSTFFWLLTMWAYVGYAARPRFGRYMLVLIFFALGLMAKPMVVSLPFVLLLIDFWPLERLQLGQSVNTRGLPTKKSTLSRLVWEKTPLFAFAGASVVVTLFAQEKGGAIPSLDVLPLMARIANGLVSYLMYIVKTFWPQDLAIFYPYPTAVQLWQVAVAGILIICLTVLVVKLAPSFPYLSVGWLWYLITLMPVIGLIQVGTHAMADRYTYVPLTGLFLMTAWLGPHLLRKWHFGRIGIGISAVAILLTLMAFSWLQLHHWKDSISLFKHALNVTIDNCLAHNSLGLALQEQGGLEDAIKHFSEAVRINPNHAKAQNNLGNALAEEGQIESAIKHYLRALQIEPDSAETHINLGAALFQKGRFDEAIRHYSEALRIEPDIAGAYNNLGIALVYQGNLDEAIIQFRKALRLEPNNLIFHRNLEHALAIRKGKTNATANTLRRE